MPKLGKTLICIKCHKNKPLKGRICGKCWYQTQKAYLKSYMKANWRKYSPRYKLHKLVADKQGDSCFDCGYKSVPEVLEVHHKDTNHKNNDLSNLLLLCPTCHAARHFRERTSSWRNYRPKL